jgi:hypothetical protein
MIAVTRSGSNGPADHGRHVKVWTYDDLHQ